MESLRKYLNRKYAEAYGKDTWDCNTEVDLPSFDFGYFRAIEDIINYIEQGNKQEG